MLGMSKLRLLYNFRCDVLWIYATHLNTTLFIIPKYLLPALLFGLRPPIPLSFLCGDVNLHFVSLCPLLDVVKGFYPWSSSASYTFKSSLWDINDEYVLASVCMATEENFSCPDVVKLFS